MATKRKATGKSRRIRTVTVRVKVSARGGEGRRAGFRACAFVGRPDSPIPYGRAQHYFKKSSNCSYGKNPRRAVAAALRGMSKKMAARTSGAFAGMR